MKELDLGTHALRGHFLSSYLSQQHQRCCAETYDKEISIHTSHWHTSYTFPTRPINPQSGVSLLEDSIRIQIACNYYIYMTKNQLRSIVSCLHLDIHVLPNAIPRCWYSIFRIGGVCGVDRWMVNGGGWVEVFVADVICRSMLCWTTTTAMGICAGRFDSFVG